MPSNPPKRHQTNDTRDNRSRTGGQPHGIECVGIEARGQPSRGYDKDQTDKFLHDAYRGRIDKSTTIGDDGDGDFGFCTLRG